MYPSLENVLCFCSQDLFEPLPVFNVVNSCCDLFI